MDEHLTHFSKVSPKSCSEECGKALQNTSDLLSSASEEHSPARGVQRIQTKQGGSQPALRKPRGLFCLAAKRAFGNYLALCCQEVKQKAVQSKPTKHDPPPNQPGPKSSQAHRNSSSSAQRHKNPSPGRGECHQMLNWSLSPARPLPQQQAASKTGSQTLH